MMKESKYQHNLGSMNINGENYYKESDLKEYMSNLLAQFENSITATFKDRFEVQEELLTVNQAAKLFDVDPQTIHNWKKNGKLKYRRKGSRIYFLKSELISSLDDTS